MELSASRIQFAAPADSPVQERRIELQEQKQLIQAVKRLNETREAGIDDSVYKCGRSGGRGYSDR
jgi:hypothetical protein